jgi:alkyl hydroperoxide reductase subunit AhpC
MKKKIILFILATVVIILVIGVCVKMYQKESYKNSIATFPEIEVANYALNSQYYNSGLINCFIIFHTECDFCLDEIEDIVDNIENFEHVNFYLVSIENNQVLSEYYQDSEFLGLTNFTIIQDKDQSILDFFNFPVSPSTFIYSKEGKLINYRNGFVSNAILKEMLNID